MVWVGRDLKDLLVPTPLLWAATPSTRPGCSKTHPAWPWTFSGSVYIYLWKTHCDWPYWTVNSCFAVVLHLCWGCCKWCTLLECSVETGLSGFIFFCAVWFIQTSKITVAFLVQVLKTNFEVLCNITLIYTLLIEMLWDWKIYSGTWQKFYRVFLVEILIIWILLQFMWMTAEGVHDFCFIETVKKEKIWVDLKVSVRCNQIQLILSLCFLAEWVGVRSIGWNECH